MKTLPERYQILVSSGSLTATQAHDLHRRFGHPLKEVFLRLKRGKMTVEQAIAAQTIRRACRLSPKACVRVAFGRTTVEAELNKMCSKRAAEAARRKKLADAAALRLITRVQRMRTTFAVLREQPRQGGPLPGGLPGLGKASR